MPPKLKSLWLLTILSGGWLSAISADQKLPTLQVGPDIYTNVTVTTVTATDIYFTHAKGMGNARLKLLPPELQKRFNFDSAKSDAVEKAQAEATANYLRQAATNRLATVKPEDGREELEAPTEDANGELVAAKLYAASFRGQRSPTIFVAEWVTPPPDNTNKFVLVDFWTSWADTAREAIPHLNDLHARFKDRVVILGLSNEPIEELQKMATPRILYSVGTDTQGRTFSAYQLKAIPHSVLIDSSGIVRYEGHSKHLDAAYLEKLIARYSGH